MTQSNSEAIRPTGGGAAYACPSCGGLIDKTCRCGRVWSDWLYAEEVVVVAMPRREPLATARLREGEAGE